MTKVYDDNPIPPVAASVIAPFFFCGSGSLIPAKGKDVCRSQCDLQCDVGV